MNAKNGIIILIGGGVLAALLFILFHLGQPGLGLQNQGGHGQPQTGTPSATTTATTTSETGTTTPATTTTPQGGTGSMGGTQTQKPPVTTTQPSTPTTPAQSGTQTTAPGTGSATETTPPPTTTEPATTTNSGSASNATSTEAPPPTSSTTTATTTPPQPPAPTSHLVGHWTFDDATGTIVADSSDYGNNGSVVNNVTPQWQLTGKLGGSLRFDGIDDYVDIPQSNSLNLGAVGQSYTVSVWYKNDVKHTAERDIVAKGGRSGTLPFAIRVDSSGDPSFRISDGLNAATVVGGDSVVTGVWQNIVAVRDASTHQIYLYINGIGIDVANDATIQSMQNTNDITLNRYQGIDGYLYDASSVDDLRIYNRALSSDEVKQLYNGTSINN